MKITKNIYWILLFFFVTITINACKKDTSTLDVNKISGVEVDPTQLGTLNSFQFDHLILDPKLNIGDLKESDLTYEWKINLIYNDTVSMVIGRAKKLDYEVRLKPNSGSDYHLVTLTVTDKSHDLKYITSWKLIVKNNIGEGLVIAESVDGVTTDISHIMSPLVTKDYTGESIKRNIYSAINGTTIPGLVKQMRFVAARSGNALFTITDSHITKINTLNYTLNGIDAALFFGPTEIKPQALYGTRQSDIYIGNGKFTVTYLGISDKFSLPLDFPSNTVPTQIAFNATEGPDVAVTFYDEPKGKFYYMPSVGTNSFADKNMYPFEPAPTKAFNPAALPGKTNLAAGMGSEEDFVHILKDKATGKVGIYTFDKGGWDSDNYETIPPSPKGFYDLSNAPSINDAVKFVVLDDQKVIYYATPTKIYAIIYSTNTPVFEERYSIPAGETLTTLQVYRQSDYPYNLDNDYLPTNNKQLILSTYGSAANSGKVYILPMINIGLGNIDQSKIKIFTGFNKISSITSQK